MGSENADVDDGRAGLPDRMHLTALDQPEQFRLHARVDVADLVEQQCAAVDTPDDTERILVRAGERAAPMAEELCIDQVGGHAGTVVRREQLARTAGMTVDEAREDFLAGAGFPRDQNRQLARRRLLRETREATHLARRPDELRETTCAARLSGSDTAPGMAPLCPDVADGSHNRVGAGGRRRQPMSSYYR